MNSFWDGVVVTLVVVLGVPLMLAVAAALLTVWFRYGMRYVKPRPMTLEDRFDRSTHAAIMFVADRVVRIGWIAGFGIYVMKQNNWESFGGESRLGNVRHSILESDEQWWRDHP